MDSIASDSRPTEPVSHQASVFSAIVTAATITDQRSSTWGGMRCAEETRDIRALCRIGPCTRFAATAFRSPSGSP